MIYLDRVTVPISDVLASNVNKKTEGKKAPPTGFTLHYIKKTPGQYNWKPVHVVFITESDDVASEWPSKITELLQPHGKDQ